MVTVPGYLQNNMSITYSSTTSKISDVINMIGRTYIENMKAGDSIRPLATEFVRDAVPFGNTIRTINITIPDSVEFDIDATDAELSVDPKTKSEYADMNFANTIPLDMYLEYWNGAFESDGVNKDFRSGVYQSIQERMNIDMYLMAKKRVSDITTTTGVNGMTGGYEVIKMANRDQADYEALLLKIKQYVSAMKYPSTLYNKQGVLNAGNDIIVAIPESTLNDIDSKVMAKIFGPNYAMAGARFVPLDAFDDTGSKPAGMDKVEAVVMDSRVNNYHVRALESYDDYQGRRNKHFIGTHVWGTWRTMFALPSVAIGSDDTTPVAYTQTKLA